MPLLKRDRLEATAQFLWLVAVVLAARVWLSNLALWGDFRIDAALIGLPFLAISRGTRFGALAGLGLGLIVDSVSPDWMGTSSVGFSLVGYFAGSFGQTMYVDRTTARGLLVAASVILFDITFGLLSRGIASPFWPHVASTFGSAVISGLAAAALTAIQRQLRTRTPSRREALVDG